MLDTARTRSPTDPEDSKKDAGDHPGVRPDNNSKGSIADKHWKRDTHNYKWRSRDFYRQRGRQQQQP
eukprot:12416907-Karenia_brevis.AAC.1